MNRKHTLIIVSIASFQDFLLTDLLSTMQNTQPFPRLRDRYLKPRARHKPSPLQLWECLHQIPFIRPCKITLNTPFQNSFVESVVEANPIYNSSGTRLFFLWWPYILDEPDEKGATSLLTKALKEFNKPIKLFKRCSLCKQTYRSPIRLGRFFSNRGQA